MTMEESIHIVFDETNFCNARKDISNEFVEIMDSLNLDAEEKLEESKEVNPSENDDQVPIVETTQEQQSELPKDWRTVKDHPLDNVIGEITKGQINLGMSEEDIATLVQAVRNSPSDASSSRPRNIPNSSESTHFPPNDNVRNYI
ncbi:hypothetical protein PIB30_104916 [Stylosanthes scabra]|uniref:Uncharacterized protein n=1 Tax=Stylosanthes scabra TaxID=79078 RepID=A0ABU6WWP5_9FABA|nr:hypothetical protein [Stylosanthes scabra]